MPRLLQNAALWTLIVVHGLIGVGSGDRLVYLGHRDGGRGHDHAGTDEHGHDHRCEPGAAHGHRRHGWLHYLPLPTPTPVGHEDAHHDDCAHVHLRGHEAVRSAPRAEAPAAPTAAAIPFFAATDVTRAPSAPARPRALPRPERPPDKRVVADARLLI